ncbi:MAG: oxidoreductase, partial [Elusimicrobia bacterium]|nr:oxidoreductase [Elusimicrobiota bacterium]
MNPPAAPLPRPAQLTREELESAAKTLEALIAHPALSLDINEDARVRLMIAAGKLSRPTKWEMKKKSRRMRSEKRRQINEGDRAARASTGIREARSASVFVAPTLALPAPDAPVRELSRPQGCYVCKQPFTRLHHFYDNMCPDCAEFNYAKRFQTADMNGRTAYITGARL